VNFEIVIVEIVMVEIVMFEIFVIGLILNHEIFVIGLIPNHWGIAWGSGALVAGGAIVMLKLVSPSLCRKPALVQSLRYV
jgi:hypothetical protein